MARLPAISGRLKTKPYSGIYWVLEIALGGCLTRLKCCGLRGKRAAAVLRGKIHGFSQKSRLRLLDEFASIDRRRAGCKPLFVALTYHFADDVDWANPKKHLRAFLKRVMRAYGAMACFWRAEVQERGVLHFHLLLWTPKFIPHEWVAENWNAIQAPDDAQNLRAGTRIERVKKWNGVMFYASKYVAKAAENDGLPEGFGRRWGFEHGYLLPRERLVYTFHHETGLLIRAAINGKRAVMGLSAQIRSNFQGVRLYQPEEAAKKLLHFIPRNEVFPAGVRDMPLFEVGVVPTEEWTLYHLPWWHRCLPLPTGLPDVLAKISRHLDPP